MQTGYLDPWRTSQAVDSQSVQVMASMIDSRAAAPEEIAARRTYLDLLKIRAGEHALDVGCGTGAVTRDLRERVLPGGHIVGVEPNPDLLAIAAERLPDVEFRQGDALRLPSDAEQFDVTICITVLEHMHDAEGAIPELVRVTKPGGRIGVMCGDQESFIVNHPDRALTRRILETFVEARFANPWIGRQVPALLEQHGVQQVQVRGLPTVDRDPTRFPAQAARLRADIALQAGAITDAERAGWLEQLDAHPAAFLAGATYLFSWGVRV